MSRSGGKSIFQPSRIEKMHTHTTPAMKPAIVESPSNSFSSMSAIELFTAVDTLISVKNTLRLTGNLASHMRADALQGFADRKSVV